VATVQAEIKQACANPDVAVEPTGQNFACAKDTDQMLWVFALLTSGDNPNFVDQSTGREGLDPVQPAQGGDIAWSLNLHHPYDPANPIDSLAVAARAINNIISGATLTSSTGSALIEPGLESKPSNCQRYTGSGKLATRRGYPAACASPVTSASGQAALVGDMFQQWMGGTPSRIAGASRPSPPMSPRAARQRARIAPAQLSPQVHACKGPEAHVPACGDRQPRPPRSRAIWSPAGIAAAVAPARTRRAEARAHRSWDCRRSSVSTTAERLTRATPGLGVRPDRPVNSASSCRNRVVGWSSRQNLVCRPPRRSGWFCGGRKRPPASILATGFMSGLAGTRRQVG
jgi:hypothetical protein